MIELQNVPAVSIDPNIITIRETCERARKDMGDLTELALSITTFGQITPILITRANELVAGERRLKACQQLNIPVLAIYRDQIDDITMKEIELEENIKRKDMTWQERIKLTKEITDIKQSKYGEKGAGRSQAGWSLQDTANLMGTSKDSAAKDVQLAKAIESIPELADAKTADDARKLLKKLEEDFILKELAKRNKEKKSASYYAIDHYRVADAIEGMQRVASNTANFADVDPPYGVDLIGNKKSKADTEALKSIGDYVEIPNDEYAPFIQTVAAEIFRILKQDSWCLWWFGPQHYQLVKNTLERVGFAIDPIPAIWYAGPGMAQTNQPAILLAKSYDTFFVCRKGKPILTKQGRHNVFEYKKISAEKKIHPTEKPFELYCELIKLFTLPGQIGIVPFLGSGNALRALYNNSCNGFGYDFNPENPDWSENIKNKFLLRVEEDIESGLYGGA